MIHQNKKKGLKLYKERLNIILDIAQTINEDHSIEDLLGEFEILLREELEVGKILVYTHNERGWENLLVSGVSDEEKALIDVERDLLQYSIIENITLSHPPQLKGFDSVIPLFHKYHPIGFVLIGDVEEDLQGISPTIKHLKLIQIISNLIVVFIENKRMQKAVLEQESMKKEMELASRIQSGLIPRQENLPQSTRFTIRSLYHPHLGVGGDYYDVIRLSRYSIGFCIADVSGKGMSAALLMSNFQAVVRSLFNSGANLKKLIHQLNRRVNESANNEKFITMFIGRYNQITGNLEYVNSGHLPPLLFDGKRKEVVSLEKGCIGLGMLDFIPTVEVGSMYVAPGSKLLTFTDGLVEIDNGGLVDSNLEQLKGIVSSEGSIDAIMEDIQSLLEMQIKANLIFDDITLMGIEFHSRGL